MTPTKAHPAVEVFARELERDRWPAGVRLAWRLRHPAELTAHDLELLPPAVRGGLAVGASAKKIGQLGPLPDPMKKVKKSPKKKGKGGNGKKPKQPVAFLDGEPPVAFPGPTAFPKP